MVKTIKKVEPVTGETVEEAVKQTIADTAEEVEVEVTVEEHKPGFMTKVKEFGRKHKTALIAAGTAVTAVAVVEAARRSKKKDVIEGDFIEVLPTFDYDKDYEDGESKEEVITDNLEEGEA